LHGVTTVGVDPVARFFGHEGGGDDPADMPFLREIAIEPVPTGSRFIDKNQMLGFGLQLADEVVDVTLACADGTEGGNLGTMLSRNVGDRNRLFVHV
jgi:hypothetical protein